MGLLFWRQKESQADSGLQDAAAYGNRTPPSNFNDHSTILDQGHEHSGKGDALGIGNHDGDQANPSVNQPPHYLGPPITSGSDQDINPKTYHQATISLGGEGIVINKSGPQPGIADGVTAEPDSGGATSPLEQKPDILKPWGGHELGGDAMGLNPSNSDKPRGSS